MVSVSELGYLGLGVSDADAWQGLATRVFGMQVVAGEKIAATTATSMAAAFSGKGRSAILAPATLLAGSM